MTKSSADKLREITAANTVPYNGNNYKIRNILEKCATAARKGSRSVTDHYFDNLPQDVINELRDNHKLTLNSKKVCNYNDTVALEYTISW